MRLFEEVVGNYKVVGHIEHDPYCQNPLEDSCGMGYIVGRGKYQTRRHGEDEMFEALCLDCYGDPDLDHAAVAARLEPKYKAWVESITGSDVESLGLNDGVGVEDLQRWLLNVCLRDDYDRVNYVWEALPYAVVPCNFHDLSCKLDDWPELELDWEAAWEAARAAGEIGDPDAVLLDVYDHSGLSWSVAGGGMQCRWDTTSGAGVWLPDDTARDEIQYRAAVYDHAYIDESGYGKHKKFTVRNRHGDPLVEYDEWGKAFDYAKQLADAYNKEGIEGTGQGRRRAAIELAESSLETYNAWLCGDCYGIVVEVHSLDEDGDEVDLVDDESCWGFIGDEWAEEELRILFDYQVEQTKKRVEEEHKQERIKNRFRDAMDCGV